MKPRDNLFKEYLSILVLLVFSIVVFLLDTLGAVGFLRSGISFIFDPMTYQAVSIGTEFNQYFETFTKLSEFRKEYNELSIDIYEKEVENAFYAMLKEENESLRKQVNLGSVDQRYVLSKVLSSAEYDFVRINKGEKDGVVVGDVVVLGNLYVGIVVKVDLEGSLARLPTSRNNSLEVVIVRGGIEEIRLQENIGIISKGVARGSSDGIRLENMSMSADLRNGDVVIVNDSRVGEYLILGYLVGLSENPAATSRTGFISPILEYDKLVTVFVRIDF